MQPLRRQQGWMGLLGLVFALVFIGLLANKVLKEYGAMIPGFGPKTEAGARIHRPRTMVEPAVNPGGATPMPADPMEKVRGLSNMIRDKAKELD